jgi:predicted RNase H-like HicB family nuclease
MMQYQVFIQNPADRLFTASVVGLPNVRSNGTTEEEAIMSLKGLLTDQLKSGKFVTIEVEVPPDDQFPAGVFENDPTFDDWMTKMAEIRQSANLLETL